MKKSTHIQDLPSHLLDKIFSYLSEEDMCTNIPFVCSRWKIVSSHSLGLLMKSASFEGKSVPPRDICYILQNTPLLKSLIIDSVNDIVPVLRQMCRCNKQVEHLKITNCTSQGSMVPGDTLINVLLCLRELKSIGLKNTKFSSPMFFEILALQSNITSIDISLNEFLTVNDIMMLVHNSKISEFKMSRRCKKPEISDGEMAHLIKMMKHNLVLLHLDMSGLGNYTYNEIFNCLGLKDLNLNNALTLSSNLLTTLSDELRELKLLKIEGPTVLIRGDIPRALFSNPTLSDRLESLKLEKLDSLDDEGCCEVLDNCKNLKVLSLKGCKSLTFRGICTSLMKIEMLTSLNVAFIRQSCGIENITKLPHLNTLLVDVLSYELNSLSKLSVANNKLKVIQLQSKSQYI